MAYAITCAERRPQTADRRPQTADRIEHRSRSRTILRYPCQYPYTVHHLYPQWIFLLQVFDSKRFIDLISLMGFHIMRRVIRHGLAVY